jgi:hypothetical protein
MEMKMTRRKFLKFMAAGIASATIPAAAVEAAAQWGIREKWITFEEFKAMYAHTHPDIVAGLKRYEGEKGKQFDINPLFKGELGIYQGVTLHVHK